MRPTSTKTGNNEVDPNPSDSGDERPKEEVDLSQPVILPRKRDEIQTLLDRLDAQDRAQQDFDSLADELAKLSIQSSANTARSGTDVKSVTEESTSQGETKSAPSEEDGFVLIVSDLREDWEDVGNAMVNPSQASPCRGMLAVSF